MAAGAKGGMFLFDRSPSFPPSLRAFGWCTHPSRGTHSFGLNQFCSHCWFMGQSLSISQAQFPSPKRSPSHLPDKQSSSEVHEWPTGCNAVQLCSWQLNPSPQCASSVQITQLFWPKMLVEQARVSGQSLSSRQVQVVSQISELH